jgi:biopolymer transport protein ExbD
MSILLTRHRQSGETWVSAFNAAPLKMNRIDDKDQSNNEKIAAFLQAKKKTFTDDVQIVISPDELVPYQDAITIYNDCMRAQFKQVAFAEPRPAEQ